MKLISKAKRDTKELLAPSSIFEKLGLRYLGPIDGHDIEGMVNFFEFAKSSSEPIVLHLLTKKEKGSQSQSKNLRSGMVPVLLTWDLEKVRSAPLLLTPSIRMCSVIIFPDWLWRMIG